MAGTKKFTISNLIPGEMYAIQVRAVDQGDNSPWSRKHHFDTIDDAHSGGVAGGEITAPTPTTLLIWEVNNVGFHAVWNAINVMLNGKPLVITHYDMEMTDAISGQTKIFKYYTNEKPQVQITFTLSMMQSIFGAVPGAVTLRVRGVNSAGTVSDWSNSLTTSMGIPDPPTNAIVTEAVDQIKISWTPPVNMNYVYGYRVYTGATATFTPGPANRIYEGATPSMAYTTTTYSLQYFKIRSYSQWGTESTDLAASGTPKSPFTIDVTPPAIPVLSGNLSTSSTMPRFAELTWTFNAATPGNEDIAGFVVAWQKVGDTNWKQNFFSEELRAGSIELPLPFADYSFKIASFDNVGNYSTYGTVLSLGGTIPGAPAQVTGVTSSATLDNLHIAWTANTESDVTYGGHYDVQIATDSGFTTGVQLYSTADTSIDIAGLAPNTTYYYHVRAVDVGNSAGIYSATGNRLTPDYAPAKSDGAAPASSPTPTLVQGVGYLTALWNRVTNNDLVTYEVHISTTTGFTPGAGTLLTETTGTSTIIRTNASKVALTYGTTYYVKIIAKDVDGAAAASTQASASVLQATNADVSDVSAGKLTAGSISAATITIAPGGSLTTSNGDVTISGTGITVGANSNISAAAMQAGTSFVDDLTVQSTFTINTSGILKSANYVAGTTGWQLTNTALDIRSGTVAAGTLVAGTITASGIKIGAGGSIVIDSTAGNSGEIKSNNYVAGTTGWRIKDTGIEMNDANSSISAASMKTSSLGAVTITVGSGGAIRSANWNGTSTGFSLSDTGFTMYTGTIQGAAVYTNQLASLSTDANSPLPPLPGQTQGPAFGINSSGKAVLSGALIYGNTVLGTSSAHQVASGNFISGSQGWLIRGDGYSEFANMRVYGSAYVGGSLGAIAGGWVLNGDGSSSFNNASMVLGNPASGSIWIVNAGGEGQFRIYPPGQTPGVSGYFHYIRSSGNSIEIRGASGGAVLVQDNGWANNVGWIPNAVVLAVNAIVSNSLYVNGYQRNDAALDVAGAFYAVGGIRSSSHGNFPSIRDTNTNAGPIFDHMNTGGGLVACGVGSSGRLQRGTSSLRYKENVGPFEYTKEQILALEPKSFNWKNRTENGDAREPGFIAEEAQALGLTQFVSYLKVDGQWVPDGFKYPNFTAALQTVVKEQQAEIDDLRSRIEALESA